MVSDMPDTSAPINDLRQLLDVVQTAVAAVREDQWTAPTPCSEWNVRDLVNHIVRGNRLFALAVRGEPPPEPGDALGADPMAAYRAAASELLEAFGQPEAMQRMISVPFGTVPGAIALHLRNTELLVHGWDLARATGQTVDFPERLVEHELQFSRAAIDQIPPGRTPFAPPQPVAEDAPAIDRLAGLLGRQV
jgi:uncharacterized protein (TIGR03086 family)